MANLKLTNLTKTLLTFKHSDKREDYLFYLVCCRELGKLGKRLYDIQPEPWLKQFLIFLYEEIKKAPSDVFTPMAQSQSQTKQDQQSTETNREGGNQGSSSLTEE